MRRGISPQHVPAEWSPDRDRFPEQRPGRPQERRDLRLMNNVWFLEARPFQKDSE